MTIVNLGWAPQPPPEPSFWESFMKAFSMGVDSMAGLRRSNAMADYYQQLGQSQEQSREASERAYQHQLQLEDEERRRKAAEERRRLLEEERARREKERERLSEEARRQVSAIKDAVAQASEMVAQDPNALKPALAMMAGMLRSREYGTETPALRRELAPVYATARQLDALAPRLAESASARKVFERQQRQLRLRLERERISTEKERQKALGQRAVATKRGEKPPPATLRARVAKLMGTLAAAENSPRVQRYALAELAALVGPDLRRMSPDEVAARWALPPDVVERVADSAGAAGAGGSAGTGERGGNGAEPPQDIQEKYLSWLTR